MSRYVLGLSALYHESAAVLLRDGVVVAGTSEERFSRQKQDSALPVRATRWCLEQAGISMGDVEAVVYYEKPLRKFERILVSQLAGFPWTLQSFQRSALTWLTDKLWVRNAICKELGVRPSQLMFSEHHLSHAASAFYCSPFEKAAVLTIDGVGEWATTSLWRADEDGLKPLSEVRFPHSLGLTYSAFTAFLGFRVNNGEYKVMGLASYGEPTHVDAVRKVLGGTDGGGFQNDLQYVSWHQSAVRSYSRAFEQLFGTPRQPGTPLDPRQGEGKRYADIAASVQLVLEERLLALAERLHADTGLDHLCMAGGVALNVVANRRLLRDGPFAELYVQPASGDAGGALGAAQWAWHEVLGQPRVDPQLRPDLGRDWSDDQVRTLLRELNVRFDDVGDNRVERAAADIVDGKVVGWFQGRCEWGPRALGHRSILADPSRPDMQDRVNKAVKLREPFRPFAPSVTAEAADEYFELPPGGEGPAEWMTIIGDVRDAHRDAMPAITHVDGSARLHRVRREVNPRYHALIEAVGASTGRPVVLNTSFNLKGDPIVSSPVHALSTLQSCEMDAVYVGPCRVARSQLPRGGAE